MNKNAHKTPKEQIVELHTGISIEQWEENNKKLDQIMKEKEEPKKTEAQKQLLKFRNQLHNLLIKYPDIRLAGTPDGDVIAGINTGCVNRQFEQIYLPTSGQQELITHYALGKDILPRC